VQRLNRAVVLAPEGRQPGPAGMQERASLIDATFEAFSRLDATFVRLPI
jgi:hypothetical protein